MTPDAILVVKCLFETIWLFFTSWYIPGTRVTPGAMMLFCCLVPIVLQFIKRLFGLGGDLAASDRRVSARESRANRSVSKK